MPFGTDYLRVGRDLLVYFSSPLANPDQGLSTALDVLGWECREEREGSAEAALARLGEAAARGPVLAGPPPMGGLGYTPPHPRLSGREHFVGGSGRRGGTCSGAGQGGAAGTFGGKAQCFGEAQYWAVQERWTDTADLMEALADLEGALIPALEPGGSDG